MNTLPVKESQIAGAILPETYKNARTAIEKCSRLDECKDWANKAEAIASYAKQAGDNTLRKCADRIQARAMLRVGELLKEIPENKGGKPGKLVGATPQVSRSSAAKDAGLSRDQKVTALRVASVPKGTFDALVESDEPPTVTELAGLGTKKAPFKHTVPPENFAVATRIGGTIGRLSRDIDGTTQEYFLAGLEKHEKENILKNTRLCSGWLSTLIKKMEVT